MVKIPEFPVSRVAVGWRSIRSENVACKPITPRGTSAKANSEPFLCATWVILAHYILKHISEANTLLSYSKNAQTQSSTCQDRKLLSDGKIKHKQCCSGTLSCGTRLPALYPSSLMLPVFLCKCIHFRTKIYVGIWGVHIPFIQFMTLF